MADEPSLTAQDPRISRFIALLESFPLISVEARTFTGQEVWADGYRFKGCTFIDCTMVSRTGHFAIDGLQHWIRSGLEVRGPAAYALRRIEGLNAAVRFEVEAASDPTRPHPD